MNWKNRQETKTELFIILGLVIVIIGFIDLIGASGEHALIAGIIILSIGIYRALKEIRRKKK